MRALALVAACGLAACAHAPAGREGQADAGAPIAAPAPADVMAGQLVVGTTAPGTPESVLSAIALDGFRFEYAAAASATSHLVHVTKADGSPLTAAETLAVQQQLAGRAGLEYVELNRVRQPR